MAMKGEAVLPQNAFDEELISWQTPEFIRYERGKLWWLGVLSVNLFMLAYAWFSASITMFILFMALPVALYSMHRQKPKEVKVVISPYGIRFGKMQIPYSNIKGFWILHDPPYLDELCLKTNIRLNSEIKIPIHGLNPTVLRNFLVTQVPEMEGKKEPLVDVIIRLLRLA